MKTKRSDMHDILFMHFSYKISVGLSIHMEDAIEPSKTAHKPSACALWFGSESMVEIASWEA
jgi:hypothetical protein